MSANRPQWDPTADTDTAPKCQNCDAQVTPQFARVFGDNRDVVHACPDCTTYRELQIGAATQRGAIDQ